jgi:hypothetical protein
VITFVVLFGDNLLKVITPNLNIRRFFIMDIKCPNCGSVKIVKRVKPLKGSNDINVMIVIVALQV